MAVLVSPGVSISVIDQSINVGAGPGTVPLIFITTQQNKGDPTGTYTVAPGTTEASSGQVWSITSQMELVQTFGDPVFYSVSGTSINGYPLNEYGLLAAYSYLGLSNLICVVRADIDTTQLEPTPITPTSPAAVGTYWFNESAAPAGSSYGLFTQSGIFPNAIWTSVTPNFIYNFATGIANMPAPNDGVVGNTAVVFQTADGQLSYWIKGNAPATYLSTATATSVGTLVTVSTTVGLQVGMAVTIVSGPGTLAANSYVTQVNSGTTFTLSATPTVALLSSTISAGFAWGQIGTTSFTMPVGTLASGPSILITLSGVGATTNGLSVGMIPTVISGTGAFAANTVITQINSPTTFTVNIAPTTPLITATIQAGFGVLIQSVWPNLAGPSVTSQQFWIKTTSAAQGANLVLDIMNATTNTFTQVEAPILANDTAADTYYSTDATGSTGQVYIEPVVSGSGLVDGNGGILTFGAITGGTLYTNGTYTNVPLTGGNGSGAIANITVAGGTVTVVTLVNGGTGYLVGDVLSASNTNIGGTGSGFSIPVATVGLGFVYPNSFEFRFSTGATNSWVPLEVIIGSTTAPTSGPANGQHWFNGLLGLNSNGTSTIDILVNNNAGAWQNCILPGFTLPGTTPGVNPTLYPQPGDPRANIPAPTIYNGDIWVQTDVQPYPVIYRYSTATTSWVLVKNSDQTTPNGIIFDDCRSNPNFVANGVSYTGANNQGGTNPDLDPDAPDGALYPPGFLLWNTRYSSNNVKVWTSPFVFNGVTAAPDNTNNGSTGRWVDASGNNAAGIPYMGADAQQIILVNAVNAQIETNQNVRSESLFYNLVAAPGFLEVTPNLLALNDDIGDIAFVCVDTPFDLPATGTALQDWATNTAGSLGDTNTGLVSASKYMGLWYPSGLTTNTDGTDVVVPPTHMALSTIAYNDQVAYPWFAPAGLQRGVVNNAASVGYVNSAGQFVPVSLNEGQRNVLYTNGINPIRVMPNGGIVIMGQKDRQNYSSATDRINVVRLENYIRYQLNILATPFLFEPNDQTTQNAVTRAFNSFFSELVTLRAIYDYLVVCDSSNNTPARVAANQLWVDVAIQPEIAVEFIYIPIRIVNTGASLTASSNSAG